MINRLAWLRQRTRWRATWKDRKARNLRQKAKKKAARECESASAPGVAAITPEGPGRQGRVP
jgi:hypothetical protein